MFHVLAHRMVPQLHHHFYGPESQFSASWTAVVYACPFTKMFIRILIVKYNDQHIDKYSQCVSLFSVVSIGVLFFIGNELCEKIVFRTKYAQTHKHTHIHWFNFSLEFVFFFFFFFVLLLSFSICLSGFGQYRSKHVIRLSTFVRVLAFHEMASHSISVDIVIFFSALF